VIDLSRNIWSLPHVVLDTETSGLPPGGRVVEISACRFENGQVTNRYTSLVDPGHQIPAEASAVHGITDDHVKGKPTLAELYTHLLFACDDAVPVAFNSPFDKFMLHVDIASTDCLAFDPLQSYVDPLVMVRDIDRFVSGKGRHKLEAACARRGIIIQGAHRAEADALATGFLLWQLKTRIGDISAADLIKRCDARRKVQDAEFAKYLASRPKETM
jgi:DNA polymerase-3 subunit epsilon